jgi:hypothetical protein
MKLTTDENGDIVLEEVYSGIGLKTTDGEYMGICMRDSGFEFNYQGVWYEAKNGIVNKLGDKSSEATPHSYSIVRWRENPHDDVVCLNREVAEDYVRKYNQLVGEEVCYVDKDVWLPLNMDCKKK